MTRTPLLAVPAAVLLFLACSNGSDQVERFPIGKADLAGVCEPETCGGPAATGNCWCDDLCQSFGDCCTDKIAVCDSGSTKDCGGLAGLICGDDEYCHYEQEQTCGAADQLGTCLPLPEACIEIFQPVCGCDGETYGNSCFANMAGTSVASDGECAPLPEEKSCGGFLGLQCGEDEYCDYELGELCGAADQLGTCRTVPEACIEIFSPVCGCDGETYGNGCFANMAGTSVASTGECN